VGLVAFAMKSYIFSIVSVVLFVAGVSAQLTVNTPSVIFFFSKSCAPFQLILQNECAFLHTCSGYLDRWNWFVSPLRFPKIDKLTLAM
jgi:hypothetical protein